MNTYRFTLILPAGSFTFGAENVQNWQSLKISLIRNITYKGLFRKFTNDFDFSGFVRSEIIKSVDYYGIDVEIYIKIELGDGNKTNNSFKTIGTLKGDMSTLNISENVRSAI